MRKIEIDELKELQYNMLLYFKSVCDKYDIKYIIAYGTLLGAVRHKGFIPWDDDIDVALLRKDYDRFVEVMKNEQHEYYRFSNMINGERVHGPYGIMEDTRTQLKHDRFDAELLKDEGVYIDIFPFDDIPSDMKIMKKVVNRQKMWKALNNLRITVKFPETDGIIKVLAKKMGRVFAKLIGTKTIFTNMQKAAKANYGQECTMAGDLMCDPRIKTCFKKEFFNETVDVQFENDYFKAPKAYDEYLRHCYGDYMQLPPVEERKAIHEYEFYWK